jgi:glutathione S-transferase
MIEKGIPFTVQNEVPWHADTKTRLYNPLEQLPILIPDDGDPVFESTYLMEWLEHQYPEPSMLPADRTLAMEAKLVHTIAEGVADATVLLFWEMQREHISAEWASRQLRKVKGGLTDLDRRVGDREFVVGDRFGLADIAVIALLGVVGDPSRAAAEGLGWAALVGLLGAAAALSDAWYWRNSWFYGHRWRVAAVGLLHGKALRLRADALAGASTGHVVSLASNDAERFLQVVHHLPHLVLTPIDFCIFAAVLYADLGVAAFAAIGAYVFAISTCEIYPFQLGFWPALALTMAVGALAGFALGAPTLRVRGDYLAIVTASNLPYAGLAVREQYMSSRL